MKETVHLSRLTKQHGKKLFKSQLTLILPIDVCLRGGPHHLQTAADQALQGTKKKPGPKCSMKPCAATDAGSRKRGTLVGMCVYHRTPNCLSCKGKDRLLSYSAFNNSKGSEARKAQEEPPFPTTVSPASIEHLGIKK